MTLNSSIQMSPKERIDYERARVRDLAFDAVHSLWRKRQADGMTQADLAKAIDGDEGWVSRTLSGPGNWTNRTLATLVAGLEGEVEINVFPLEEPPLSRSNYDAYVDYFSGETATENTDYKETWKRGTWLPDLTEGSDDLGNVVVEIRRP